MTNRDGQNKYRLQIILSAWLAVLPLTFPLPARMSVRATCSPGTRTRALPATVMTRGLAGEEQLLPF
jgi:hypothetical protein